MKFIVKNKIIKAWEKAYIRNPENQQAVNGFLEKELDDFSRYLNEKDSILDIGGGIGDKANYLQKKGFLLTSVDSSKKSISFGKKKYSKIKFYVKDAIKMNFGDKKFDAILIIAVLHCLEKGDRIKVIQEMSKILKKNGKIFGLVLSSKDTCSKKGKLASKNTYLTDSGTIFHFFTKKELLEEFGDFKILKLKHNSAKNDKKQMANFTFILEKV